MKKLIASAVGVVCLVGVSYCVGVALGQNAPDKKESPHKVGLIDMATVFKKYSKFEKLREDLKGEVQESEQKAKGFVEQIQALQGELKSGTFKEGSPDFIEREKQITQLTTEFETFRKLAQTEFIRKEAKIYQTVYLEVTDAVEKFSKYYNYTLIQRFERDEVANADPQKVMQRLNRQVVYFRPEDDITESVVEYLNGRYEAQARGGARKPAGATEKGAIRQVGGRAGE